MSIERGPLAGVEGILADVKGKSRLVVSINLLRRSVCAEVERTWVRPVRPMLTVPAVTGAEYLERCR